jgi:hypothetical protein
MHCELWRSNGAGRQENPFSFALRTAIAMLRHDLPRTRHEISNIWNLWSKRYPIRNNRIHVRRIYHGLKMVERQIGRKQNDAACNTVKLEQGQCGRKLVSRQDEHRPPTKFIASTIECGPCDQIAQGNTRPRIGHKAAGQIARRDQCVPKR